MSVFILLSYFASFEISDKVGSIVCDKTGNLETVHRFLSSRDLSVLVLCRVMKEVLESSLKHGYKCPITCNYKDFINKNK